MITPAYTVHLGDLLSAWRQQLLQSAQLQEEHFEPAALQLNPDGIVYKDIHASKIIFCDGAAAAQSVYFNRLPFSRNKGEALTLHIPGLSPQFIYKKSSLLVSLPEKDLFWLGGNNAWEFNDDLPTPAWQNEATALLKSWLKIPFTITGHKAALRPATVERRPFVGLHPVYPAVGILNGMGTKGCSLAPWFAKELAHHLVYGKPITAEADVKRFTRILSRE